MANVTPISFRREGRADKAPHRKPVESASNIDSAPFIEPVCERIYRDWLRGVRELYLAKMFRCHREEIEAAIRWELNNPHDGPAQARRAA